MEEDAVVSANIRHVVSKGAYLLKKKKTLLRMISYAYFDRESGKGMSWTLCWLPCNLSQKQLF